MLCVYVLYHLALEITSWGNVGIIFSLPCEGSQGSKENKLVTLRKFSKVVMNVQVPCRRFAPYSKKYLAPFSKDDGLGET